MFTFITKEESIKDFGIGAKAKNLFSLRRMGFIVPHFIVVPQEVLNELLPANIFETEHKNIIAHIQQVTIPQSFIIDILSTFKNKKYFAVRSSAMDEDGTKFSFAGQFESFLFVTKENLADKIKQVWCSLFTDRVIAYRKNNNLSQHAGIAVIIQEMIDADVAGVAFGINPLNKNENEKWINAVYGLGQGLVSGELNADQFIISNGVITKQLAQKTDKMILDPVAMEGIKKAVVQKEIQNLATLTDSQIFQLGDTLEQLFNKYKVPQDIEFAFKDETLFLLQARPVTKTQHSTDHDESFIIWDNSNIIESYPGVTTPLTFSFISHSYEDAYKLFCGYMGISSQVIKENERVFANTLGLINGRVYYNLRTWYHMLAMAPGYSINARFMEKMMGVKERFDIPVSYRMTRGKAFLRIAAMVARMYSRYRSLPQKRTEFFALVNKTIHDYKKVDFAKKNAFELMHLYLAFEKKLLNEWKAPLLNDFFAMIAYGTLQKRCEKYKLSANPNIHNDLLCGSSDIISTQPIHRCLQLATTISSDKKLKELFLSENETTIWNQFSASNDEQYITIKKDIDNYINDFGERCIGELKLETISFNQDPSKFIKVLKSYVESGITSAVTSGKIEESIRKKAEVELEDSLRKSWYKKWKLKRLLRKARELVSARENLRYERTRAFGMVREMFSAIGKRFYLDGILENERDIFYLTKHEIFSFIEGTS
ncbi:MAG: PEP/pyruvate-binding domain-containing protein, partial [Ginsengibacter sp.]